jgi:hypothetical protein
MPNVPHLWKDRDAKRLLRVVEAAGLNPVALEVDLQARRIRVKVGKSEARREGAEEMRDAPGR